MQSKKEKKTRTGVGKSHDLLLENPWEHIHEEVLGSETTSSSYQNLY